MSDLIDGLITRYQMDHAQYEAGAKRVEEATRKVGEVITETTLKAKEAFKGVFEHLGIGEVLAPIAALATAGGILEIGKDALATSRQFDVLERKIEGVTGSLKLAKEQMDFAERESAMTGLFKPAELDEAALSLDRFGLSVKKYLPLVESLSAVTGSGMDEFADALGMLAHGEGERALRILERAGITVQELRKHGVNVYDNKITGSPQQAINGISATINDKYGGVLADMMNSPEAKAARAAIAWEGALRKIGGAIDQVIIPAEEGIAEGLNKVEESGALDRVVKSFQSLFSLDGKSISGMIEEAVAGLERVPQWISSHKGDFKDIWKSIKDIGSTAKDELLPALKVASSLGKDLLEAFRALPGPLKEAILAIGLLNLGTKGAVGSVLGGIGNLKVSGATGAALGGLADGESATIGALVLKTITGPIGLVGAALIAGAIYLADLASKGLKALDYQNSKRLNERSMIHDPDLSHKDIYGRIVRGTNRPTTAAEKAADDDAYIRANPEQAMIYDKDHKHVMDVLAKAAEGTSPKKDNDNPEHDSNNLEQQTTYLGQIAQHTESLSRDMKRFALGGGDLARIGVSAVTQNKGRHAGYPGGGMSGVSHSTSAQLMRIIGMAIEEGVGHHMAEYQRGNAFGA